MPKIDGVIGLPALKRQMREVRAEIDKEIAKALFLGGLKIEEHAKTAITQGTKTGKVYKRGKVTHRASAPGEAPANDTGRLLNSIHVEASEKGKTVRVKAGGKGVKYAAALEFGTERMAERPFFRPALKDATPFIQERCVQGVNAALERAAKTR